MVLDKLNVFLFLKRMINCQQSIIILRINSSMLLKKSFDNELAYNEKHLKTKINPTKVRPN